MRVETMREYGECTTFSAKRGVKMVAMSQIGRKLARKRTAKTSSEPIHTPTTGAQLLAYWDAEDVGGVYADKSKYSGNAQETARALRQREEARV